MTWRPRKLGLLCSCLFVLGCASADQLARRSEMELRTGHAQKAYDQARKALKKDRSNARARAALASAGVTLAHQRQDQVLALAMAGDTLAAGESVRQLDAFRRELAGFGASPPPDTAFTRTEHLIRVAAAGIHYQRGREELDAGRAKSAYDDFLAAHDLVPGYRDVEARIRASYQAALTRVAIFPFENQTDVRGLSVEMADKINAEVGRHITPKEFRFTVLLGRDDVYARIPVSALSRLEREDALRIGRELGADRVVVGRFYGLRSQNNDASYVITTYRHQPHREKEEQDASTRKEYVEEKLSITRHERRVWVTYDFSILDTQDGTPLLTRSATLPATASVVWTDYEPVGDCNSYALYTPELQKQEPETVKDIQGQWRECAGDWGLPAFLERARSERRHVSYRPEDRQLFFDFSPEYPVFLGELPPEDDLAFVALDRVWEPLLAALRELDE